jgi:hypothetical protein
MIPRFSSLWSSPFPRGLASRVFGGVGVERSEDGRFASVLAPHVSCLKPRAVAFLEDESVERTELSTVVDNHAIHRKRGYQLGNRCEVSILQRRNVAPM